MLSSNKYEKKLYFDPTGKRGKTSTDGNKQNIQALSSLEQGGKREKEKNLDCLKYNEKSQKLCKKNFS